MNTLHRLEDASRKILATTLAGVAIGVPLGIELGNDRADRYTHVNSPDIISPYIAAAKVKEIAYQKNDLAAAKSIESGERSDFTWLFAGLGASFGTAFEISRAAIRASRRRLT
ncbi:MAG: hypothetical protein ACXWLH_04580 [Candidatus Saccharimonadales bacterium]